MTTAHPPPPPHTDICTQLPEVQVLEYPSGAAHVQEARHATVAMITGSPSVPDEIADTAALVVSELATNAVQHGSGALRVHLIIDPGSHNRAATLRIEVPDENAAPPVLQRTTSTTDPDELLESGRGWGLVLAMADCCGVEPRARGGKIVWAQWQWAA
ncbi:ATP-binding protein [Streptomyces sp. NPDC008343]|uniref:ATP-binding protein n=1 Tax=Streptomyces sp. NPDC008343 TaxID=3364828 RepID=UPI0036EC9CA3